MWSFYFNERRKKYWKRASFLACQIFHIGVNNRRDSCRHGTKVEYINRNLDAMVGKARVLKEFGCKR
jgi:hypothetical protein